MLGLGDYKLFFFGGGGGGFGDDALVMMMGFEIGGLYNTSFSPPSLLYGYTYLRIKHGYCTLNEAHTQEKEGFYFIFTCEVF